ncbi:TfuA-like protein [Nonomuraea sp. NPDC050783]|uniref:TfuA-like protein n=1 Tax=Nonomuraea sp. NPDC050783 TaxID=3154634 RepID=UPI003465A646
MTGRTHVFLGPSLARDIASKLLPEAHLHPPVAHGDLLRLRPRPGDHVVLIDGVFQQTAAVRHKEILDLLDRGVRVTGAASMGALRAAELAPFGMRGAGIVYRLYALGMLNADDEVALVHDGEHNDPRPRTVALVSVRILAHRLRVRGRLTHDQRKSLVEAARRLHFTTRTWTALLAHARQDGLPEPVIDRLRAIVRRPATTWDVKSQDAVRALTADPPVQPTEPARWPVTGYLARWRTHPQSDTSMLLTAAQLWAADYPSLHYRVVLRAIASEHAPVPPDADVEALQEAAVRAAYERALLIPEDLIAPRRRFAYWLGPDEHPATASELLARVLVRSYRWGPHQPPLTLLHDAVMRTPAADLLRDLLRRVRRLNESLARRGHPVERVTDTTVLDHCRRRWAVPVIAPALHDRGFISPGDLLHRARPLIPAAALLSPPAFTLQP